MTPQKHFSLTTYLPPPKTLAWLNTIVLILALGTTTLWAQEPLKSPKKGSFYDTQRKKYEQNSQKKVNTAERTTAVKKRVLERESPSLHGNQKPTLAKYGGGAIPYRSLEKRKQQIQKSNKDATSYQGRILVKSNSERQQANKAKQMANFKGAVMVKIRKPTHAKTTWQAKQPTKPMNYDRSRLQKGAKVRPSELPNYLKNKPASLQYNKKESEWMRPESVYEQKKSKEQRKRVD
jgi:hypothetical protein